MGPLEKAFELHEQCNLDDFLAAVLGSRFLQFSSTHTELSCRIDGKEVARVFSPYEIPERKTEFVAPPDTQVRAIATNRAVEFVFDRA